MRPLVRASACSLSTLALCLSPLFTHSACSVYDESLVTGGAAGAGAQAGTSGTGGSNTGGSGVSGNSGSNQGGSAGNSGASGSAGSSGSSAGAAGTSGGGTAGVSGSSGSSGTAGSGGSGMPCSSPSECPGEDSICSTRTCNNNQCGVDLATQGTEDPNQDPGDCKKRVCDGAGMMITENDDNDLPDDQNPCTEDTCTAGEPGHSNIGEGISCGTNLICDGTGQCTGCVTKDDCPGQDTECSVRVCNNGVCGNSFTQGGTLLANQTLGDCKNDVCDGNGLTTTQLNTMDIPGDDGNPCTDEACVAGQPAHPNASAGTTCSVNGGTECDGMGACIPTCNDNTKNGNETAIDCGGGTCAPCANGLPCNTGTDCESGSCVGMSCAAVAPTVISTSPADATSGTTPSTISITFSEAMNGTTLTAQTSKGACSGSIQVSANNFASCIAFSSATASLSMGNTIATLTPSILLSQTRYKIKVTTAAQSAAGLGLTSAFTQATGFTTAAPPSYCSASPVVISQVYGGGGNSGAPYQNDFIELHNRGPVAVSLAGWSVQYAGASGTTWSATNLSGSIPAGGYYLVKEQSGGAVGAVLPTADATGTINMGGTGGKVALVNSTTVLSGACPVSATIVDLVGYGTSTGCFETAPTANLSNTTAAIRSSNGCIDTGSNNADFSVGAPTPRNSTNITSCGCEGASNTESGATNEVDYCVLQAPSTLSPAAGQATALVYGRVYEVGFTEAAGANAQILAQCGYGPAASDPTTSTSWVFFDATYNTQYNNDDEYQVSMTAPSSGSYSYTYRFSRDAGATWTYCDLDGAGSNTNLVFSSASIGTMTVPLSFVVHML